MGNAIVKLCLLIPGLLLHGVRPPVQRQYQEIHNQAQDNDRQPRIANQIVGNRKNNLKKQF